MKIYNSKKCYCCFQKFENNNHFYENILIQKNLNYDCIKNIMCYLTPKKYQLNILNEYKKYYCKKCISIIIYQYNKHGQFSSYYKHKFLSLRKSMDIAFSILSLFLLKMVILFFLMEMGQYLKLMKR